MTKFAMSALGLSDRYQELHQRFLNALFPVGHAMVPVFLNWVGDESDFEADLIILRDPFGDGGNVSDKWPLAFARNLCRKWETAQYKVKRSSHWIREQNPEIFVALMLELGLEAGEVDDPEHQQRIFYASNPTAPWHLPYLALFAHAATCASANEYYPILNKMLGTSLGTQDLQSGEPPWGQLWKKLQDWSIEAGRGRFVAMRGSHRYVSYPQMQVLLRSDERKELHARLREWGLGAAEIDVPVCRRVLCGIANPSPQLNLTLNQEERLVLLRDTVRDYIESVGEDFWFFRDRLDRDHDGVSREPLAQCVELGLVIEYDRNTVERVYWEPLGSTVSDVEHDFNEGLEWGGRIGFLRSIGSAFPASAVDCNPVVPLCGYGSHKELNGYPAWTRRNIRILVPDGGRWIEDSSLPLSGDVLLLCLRERLEDYVVDGGVHTEVKFVGPKRPEILVRLNTNCIKDNKGLPRDTVNERIRLSGGIRLSACRDQYFSFALPRLADGEADVTTFENRVISAGDRLCTPPVGPLSAHQFQTVHLARRGVAGIAIHSAVPVIKPPSPEQGQIVTDAGLLENAEQLTEHLDLPLTPALLLVQIVAHRSMSYNSCIDALRELFEIHTPSASPDASKFLIRNLLDLGHIESVTNPDGRSETLCAGRPELLVSRCSLGDGSRSAVLVGGHDWWRLSQVPFTVAGIKWSVGNTREGLPRVMAAGTIENLKELAIRLGATLTSREHEVQSQSNWCAGVPQDFNAGFPFDRAVIEVLNPFSPMSRLKINTTVGVQHLARLVGENGVFAFQLDRSEWYLGRIGDLGAGVATAIDGWCQLGERTNRLSARSAVIDNMRWAVVCASWQRLADVTDRSSLAKPPLLFVRRSSAICVPAQLPLPAVVRRWLCRAVGCLPIRFDSNEIRSNWIRVVDGPESQTVNGSLFASSIRGYCGHTEADAKYLSDHLGLRLECVG